jgi:hypothetical protein
MLKQKSIIVFIAILAFLPACLFATPVSVNGKLKVSGLQLVNSCGNAVQLRGVSSHGLQYYPACYPTAALDFAANGIYYCVFDAENTQGKKAPAKKDLLIILK